MDEILLASLAGRYALAGCPEWRSLLRLLDYAEGFAFVPLILPDAAGAEVCRRELVRHLAAEGKSLLSLHLTPVEKDGRPLRPLLDLAIPDDAGVLWVTPDPDLWADDARYDPARTERFEDRLWPLFCNHANQARDVIRHRLKLPLILVGTDKLRENLRRHAPDLWSIRDALIKPEPRQDTRPLASLSAGGGFPLEIPGLPPVTGDLGETLREIERMEKDHTASPALPVLLKRAARLEMQKFQWQAAEEHLTQALAWEEKHHAHFSGRILTHNLLQSLFDTIANHGRGIFHAERALEIARNEFPPDSPEIAIHLNNLAGLLQDTNRLAEAEPLMREALRIDRAAFGDDHPDVARDLNNLAQLLQATNRPAEAEPLMRDALRIDRAALGDEHPHVARDLNNLAQLLHATNRLADAEPLMRDALRIDRASYGDDHPLVAIRLNNLAGLLQATNRLAEAEPLMRDALRIDRAAFGDDHPDVARDLNNLAGLLQATNRLDEAEPLMREALRIDRAAYGDEHPQVANRLNNLAGLLQATNRMAEAVPLLREALRICHASLGPEHPDTVLFSRNLDVLLGKMKALPPER